MEIHLRDGKCLCKIVVVEIETGIEARYGKATLATRATERRLEDES